MKIIFEHEGRKTTVIGNDYNTIVEKIRSLFPDQKHRRIQFYDPELTDFFEFTSFEQVIDQPNGLRMTFDLSQVSDPTKTVDACLSNENHISVTSEMIIPTSKAKRIRKKPQSVDVSIQIHLVHI